MSLKRGVFYTFLTQFPVAFLGVVAGIFTTRLLGPEGKGVFAIFQSDIALLSLFFGINIGMGVVYFISSSKYSAPEMLGMAIRIISISMLTAIVFLVSSFYIPGLNSLIYPGDWSNLAGLIFIFTSLVFTLTHTIFSSIFQGLRQFRVVNQVTLINSVMNVMAFSALYFWSGLEKKSISNLWVVLTFTSALYFINVLTWLYYYVKLVGAKPVFNNAGKYNTVWAFIFIGYISNLVNMLNYRLDIWIVNSYEGEIELGYYSLAANIAQMFLMISAPIALVLQPYLNGSETEESKQKIMLFSRLNFSLVFILAIMTCLLAAWAIPLVYGKEFGPTVPALLVLLPGILFACSTQLFALMPIKFNKIKYNLVATLAGLFVTIVLDLLLIPKYGIIGAGIASSMAYFCIFITVLYFCFYRLQMPWGNYFIFLPKDLQQFKRL